MKDVAVDSRDNPRLIQVAIKQSKTDPFRRGVNIYLGATDRAICPVKAMSAYLALRGGQAGPLFITQEGKGLTRLAFSSALDSLLSKLKLNHKHYNTHSFRIGAATSATQARIPDSQIKMLGRWPISVTSKPLQQSLLSYQRNWLRMLNKYLRNCYFNLPLVYSSIVYSTY